ncbi:hypothetical protein Droror1_Dr00026380 [Drosera rotundifolia]
MECDQGGRVVGERGWFEATSEEMLYVDVCGFVPCVVFSFSFDLVHRNSALEAERRHKKCGILEVYGELNEDKDGIGLDYGDGDDIDELHGEVCVSKHDDVL